MVSTLRDLKVAAKMGVYSLHLFGSRDCRATYVTSECQSKRRFFVFPQNRDLKTNIGKIETYENKIA